MKKTLRSPVMWIVVFCCVIVAFLYFEGFRITYAPELENSWDAISACAGWFGAIMSAIAIFVAISIPKKIAEQQNRISLFEKRYIAFNSFAFLTSVVEQIANGNVIGDNPQNYFNTMAETYNSVSVKSELTSDCKDASSIYIRLIFEAGKIKYLFDLDEMELVIDFLLTVDMYISGVYKGKPIDKTKLQVMYDKLNTDRISDKLEAQLEI